MPRRRSHIVACETDMEDRKEFNGNPEYTPVPDSCGLFATTGPSNEWDLAFGEGASEQFNDPLYEPSEIYEMEDTDLVDSSPVPLRRSERLRPFYVDREVEPAGHNIHETREKLLRNQRLMLRYSFSSDDDTDDETIPAQEAHSHNNYVGPDNRVHGRLCNCAEFLKTYCAECCEVPLEDNSKTSTKRASRRMTYCVEYCEDVTLEDNCAEYSEVTLEDNLKTSTKRASRRKQSRPNRFILPKIKASRRKQSRPSRSVLL